MNKKNQISSILNYCNNLFDIFNYHLAKNPYKKVFYKKEKIWDSCTFIESAERIKKISFFFLKNKIKKGDRVFLLSNNRIEWVEFDLAIMSLGGITVPSFVTNNVADNEFIINDCLPRFIVLENEKIFEKNKKFLNKFTAKIILIENSQNFVNYKKITSIKFKEIKNVEVKREDISSIIYTSGTLVTKRLCYAQISMHNLKGV